MVKVIHHRKRRGSNVEHRRKSLQLMMPRFVEEVAEPDNSRGFAREIGRQARRAAAEEAGHRVQFLSAILKDGPAQREISSAESGYGRK